MRPEREVGGTRTTAARSVAGAFRLWRDDDVLRRLLRNVGHLLSGRAVAAALGIVTLAVTARALGPADLGILVMVIANAQLIDQLVRLETWQALIKHGSDALAGNQEGDFRQLLKFGAALDLAGATAAGSVLMLVIPLAGDWLGWDPETETMARVFGLAVFFHFASTPIAILRLFGRFATLAWLEAGFAGLRLSLAAAAWLAGGGIWTFLLLTMAVEIAHRLALVGLALAVLRRHGHGAFLTQPLGGVRQNNPGIWAFIVAANLAVLIRKSTEEVDVLVIGALLGPGAVGLYHVVKRLGIAALKYGALLQQAVFPDLARLWAQRAVARFRQTVLQVSLASAAFATGVLLIVAFSAEHLLQLIAGPGFEEAALPLIVQMVAATLALCGVTLRPALQSMGRQGMLLGAVVAGALGFYLCLLLALPTLGVVGASFAHVVFHAIWLPVVMTVFLNGTRPAAERAAAEPDRVDVVSRDASCP